MEGSHCWVLDRPIKTGGEEKKKKRKKRRGEERRGERGERGADRKEQWDRRIKDKSPP